MLSPALALALLLASTAGPTRAQGDEELAAIRALPTAEERASAVRARLAVAAEEELSALYQIGFEEFLAAAGDHRADRAVPLAEALHARARAPWSAMSLALICRRAGNSAREIEVLREALEGELDPLTERDLRVALGHALLTDGATGPGLSALGSAFCRGSENAGVVLGRMALREGRPRQARAIFRTLLRNDPPPSWALRGWGLSLLPANRPR